MNNDRFVYFTFGALCGTITMGYLAYKEGMRHGDEMFANGIDLGIKLEKLCNELESMENEEE